MFTNKSYSVEAGKFYVKDGALKIRDSDLKLPFVGRTYMGRAADTQEQSLCDGFSVSYLDGPNIHGQLPVKFFERPNYNGNKIIVPNVVGELSSWISRDHGELRFGKTQDHFPSVEYVHLSNSGMNTFLWDPTKSEITPVGQKAVVPFDFKGGEGEVYMLLGGHMAKTIEEAFPHYSFYIKLEK